MNKSRRFLREVVISDAFAALDDGVQALYVLLCMSANADGFLLHPERLAAARRCGVDGLEALVRAGFLLRVEGQTVVTHWFVSDQWRNRRRQLPFHREAAKKLFFTDRGAYQLEPDGPSLWERRQRILEA